MRTVFIILIFFGLQDLKAAPPDTACRNMESMIGFVEDHILNALEAEELQMARYHTFKALNTLVKSENNFGSCHCDFALKSIRECEAGLKLATRVSTIDGTQILLKRALKDVRATEDALEEHMGNHTGTYDNEVIAMNTLNAQPRAEGSGIKSEMLALESKIDQSLIAYRKSLDEVVRTVPCDEALEFVRRVYAHCEKQLLREDLSAAKRYYNIKTKEITEQSLDNLRNCSE